MVKEKKAPRVVFMGTPFIAKEILSGLIDSGMDIVGVITQPDRPSGRKKEVIPSSVKEYALDHNLELKQFEKITQPEIDWIRTKEPALIVVVAFGLILPGALLNIAPFGCINVHASLLPTLRGPSPIQTALLMGLKETGITIMLMDEKIDHGKILSQKKIKINNHDTYPELEKKIIKNTNQILPKIIRKWTEKKVKPTGQNHHEATFTKIIFKQDGKIIWANSSQEIYNQFRAYFFWPKVFAYWPEKSLLKQSGETETVQRKKVIFHAIDFDINENHPDKKLGEVFLAGNNRIAIQTNKGVIFPKNIQLEGKTSLPIDQFINGSPKFLGSVLE